MRFAAAAIAAASRDAIDTCAPSSASARATANPSPLLAPPTIAILFASPRSTFPPFLPFPPSTPLHHPIQRFARRPIELTARRADAGMRDRAAPLQHFLANRHPNAFLELEAPQRHPAIE